MTDNDTIRQTHVGDFVSSAFGDNYLFSINHNTFENADASTVFRSYFGESLFEENTFYVIAGTDSGLLYQHIKTQGIPDNSRYLFVELPQVLSLLDGMAGESKPGLVATSYEEWMEHANELEIQKYILLNRVVLIRSLGVVHGHCGDYALLWRNLKEDIEVSLWEHGIVLSDHQFTTCQIDNLTENQVPAIHLRDTFKGKTAVLLAGGPSLDELLPWVQQHRSNLLVIAVSRISRSLLDAGIQPDICASVDPNPINLKVSQEMLEFQNGTLLVNKHHLSTNLLSSWGGKKVFVGTRYPWPTSLEPENIAEPMGATVTNTAMAIAVETGVAQIILGGVDFCFSQEGYTHASGSAEHAMGPMPQLNDQQVETNGGELADTLNAFRESAASVNSQALQAMTLGCRTINPAAGAMRLTNVEYFPLESVQIEPLERPAREILSACLPLNNAAFRTRLYKETLHEVDRVLADLATIKELSNKALNYSRKLSAKGRQETSSHNNAKIERIEKQLYGKYVDTTTFIKRFGLRRFVHILGPDKKGGADAEHTSQLYYQAFVKTSSELIKILRQARSRILSRQEEDKTCPNVQHLLKQWQHDKQPGRAIQWAQHHADYVNQLPEPQQQALRAYQDSFEDVLEEINQDYLAIIEKRSGLDGTLGNAQGCFQCQDQAGLQRLLSSLQSHQDQTQATNFIPLVQGYLAELRGEPETAITDYQRIVDGPAQFHAATRLFALHSEARNLDEALKVLKVLSSINSDYTPMYADMLQATGDVDTAIEIYTDHLLANPDDLDSMMKLGKLFLQGGSGDGVAWTMNYILDRDPDNQAARSMLDLLEPSQANGQ